MRLATGALVRPTCPTTATRASTAQGDAVDVRCCRPRTCGCCRGAGGRVTSRLSRRPPRGAARRDARAWSARARLRARRRSATITREAGASLGLLNYHFASKDEVVAEAFARDRARGPGRAGGDRGCATSRPPSGWPPSSTLSGWGDRDSWRLWIDAWGEAVHARRRCARRSQRFARGWRALLARVLADGAREGAWACADPARHRGAARRRHRRDRPARHAAPGAWSRRRAPGLGAADRRGRVRRRARPSARRPATAASRTSRA